MQTTTTEPTTPIFPLTLSFPPLNPGEKYAGLIISADGRYRHHLILLPEEAEPNGWQTQMEWAASLGGDLPDRVESALLFATMGDEFAPEWYWAREQLAADSVWAWLQGFGSGFQYDGRTSTACRARAVRRIKI